MITFSNLKHHELFEIQSDIKIICDLQKNVYLKDLEENEIEEILYYKRLFEDIYKDFQELGIQNSNILYMKVHYYYPYKSDKPEKKYYIITKTEKKIYFGAAGYSDFTKHKDEARKQRYIKRHENNEDWGKSGIDTAGFWSRWLLWSKPTIKESYEDIKRRFL